MGLLFILTSLFNFSYNAFFYNLFLDHFSIFKWDSKNLGVQALALLVWEFCYYFQHRTLHTVKFMWKGHNTHHSGKEFNLTTTFRRSSTDFIYNWIFFIPMAILGFPLISFIVAANFSVAWGFCTHTRFFPRIKFFEEIFVGSSSHRVHHGANHPYFNKNFGSVLLIWDRLFGTYQKELKEIPLEFGVPKPISSFNPVKVNLIPYLTRLNSNSNPIRLPLYYLFLQMIYLVWVIFKFSINYMDKPLEGILPAIFLIYFIFNFGEILDGKRNVFWGELLKFTLIPFIIIFGYPFSLKTWEIFFLLFYLIYSAWCFINWKKYPNESEIITNSV